MIDKLEELLKRVRHLKYKDNAELDDIKRKTKLYLEQIFPSKFTYPGEVDIISFSLRVSWSGTTDQDRMKAWKKGADQLINLIDTRIVEAKLLAAQPQVQAPRIKSIEKEVKVIDNDKVNALTEELKTLTEKHTTLKNKKNLLQRIGYAILLTVLGGTFLLGTFIGGYRFDKEKNELYDKNKELIHTNDSLEKVIRTQKVEMYKSQQTKQ